VFVVTATELRELVPMSDAIEAVQQAFLSVTAGIVDQPPRLVADDGSLLAMLATHRSDGGAGTRSPAVCKIVSIGRRQLALPALHAVAVWFDGDPRRPHLLLEGASLTSLRTGAAVGVASRLLASPTARTLTIVGAGGQAPDQIAGVCAVRTIDEIRICSRSGVSAKQLAEKLAPLYPGSSVSHFESVEQAVEGADIICCATTSASPVVPEAALSGRVHVNAIGSYRRGMAEISSELLARAELVCVDSAEAALAEAGEVIAAIESGSLSISAIREIGHVLSAPSQIFAGTTVFKTVGIAIQDWAICRLVSERLSRDAGSFQL
jgi:ornithine cyclodeaminase